MTQDPIQPLADIGRRVLQTARYLTTPPVPDQLPGSYESQLGDPVVALSGICGGLLERLAAAPLAAEPESFTSEQVTHLAPAPNPRSASPTLSRHGVPGSTAERRTVSRDEVVYSRTEDRPTELSPERSDMTGPGLRRSEQSHRSIAESGASENEPDSRDQWEAAASRESGGEVRQTDDQEASLRPAIARHAPGSRETRHVPERRPTEMPPSGETQEWPEGEPSPEARRGEARPPVRQDLPEARQTESPSDARDEIGRARVAAASDAPFPAHGSRLTASAERLAAMLNSHVAQPETALREGREDSQEERDVFPSRQGDEERGTSLIAVEQGRTWPGFEEIMEKLADELETEFVRTYGSSGG